MMPGRPARENAPRRLLTVRSPWPGDVGHLETRIGTRRDALAWIERQQISRWARRASAARLAEIKTLAREWHWSRTGSVSCVLREHLDEVLSLTEVATCRDPPRPCALVFADRCALEYAACESVTTNPVG